MKFVKDFLLVKDVECFVLVINPFSHFLSDQFFYHHETKPFLIKIKSLEKLLISHFLLNHVMLAKEERIRSNLFVLNTMQNRQFHTINTNIRTLKQFTLSRKIGIGRE